MLSELKIAIEAAKAGAKASLVYFNNNPKVTVKPDNTPVTRADKEGEEAIKKVILGAFPNASFLGEESGSTGSGETVWVIDPVDGTKNFIRGIPFWGIEIALVKKNEIVLGVSLGPVMNELMYAEKGKGAFLNGKKVSVSKIAKLSDALINHGTLHYFKNRMPRVLDLIGKTYRERGYADFYGYHLVASGRADIMLDAKNGPWDIAALKIIVEEAGGRVTNYEGDPWQLSDTTGVATNRLLHDEVIKVLNE